MNNQNSLNVTSWVANKGCNIFNNIHSDSQRVRKKIVYTIYPTLRSVIGWEALRGGGIK